MRSHSESPATKSALASLRRYAQPRAVHTRCELCSAELADSHPHLVELASRRLICACDACAILFGSPGAVKFRRIPQQRLLLSDFRLTDVQWEGLQLPINLAFFIISTTAQRAVALYPSPAGVIEALPPPGAWEELLEENPTLRRLEPDVEALLVNRLGAEPEYFRVGIDDCYALVGLIRAHWRGLSGGAAVWEEVKRFFTGLKERSRVVGDTSHD
jgi:hypothetical protein